MDRPDSLPDDLESQADSEDPSEESPLTSTLEDDFVFVNTSNANPAASAPDFVHDQAIQPGSWHSLPRDVIILLLEYLSPKEIARLSQVNHRTQRLCNDNATWARLAKARWPSALLRDVSNVGDWKQLYGEMALREKGIDTIRIVMESGPILVRTRNQKMRGVVYIHLRKPIHTRGLFLTFEGVEISRPIQGSNAKTIHKGTRAFPPLLGRFPFPQRSKEDMPLAAGSHSFPFEFPAVVSRRLNNNAYVWFGPSLESVNGHSATFTLKALLVVVGIFNSDLSCTTTLDYTVPAVPRRAMTPPTPPTKNWPINAGPRDFQILFETPRLTWTSGEVATVKLTIRNPSRMRIKGVQHTVMQCARYANVNHKPTKLWTWPTFYLRLAQASTEPVITFVINRKLPSLAGHHHSFSASYSGWSVYYAFSFLVLNEGDRPGPGIVPIEWPFMLVPVEPEGAPPAAAAKAPAAKPASPKAKTP